MNQRWKNQLPLHLMILPAAVIVLIYCYIPMVGIGIAFQDFSPVNGILGSPWVGLQNFIYVFTLPDTLQVIFNTVFIAVMKIAVGLIVPIVFALLLNEIGNVFVKRSIQSLVYLPHFLSWVILGGIMIDILSPSSGIVNSFLGVFGIKPIFFLGDELIFPYTMVATDVWKEFGFNSIIYLAALTNISPTLYKASEIDGASRWKQIMHVTLPGILPIVVLMTALSLGNVLNAGFDQIFNLYSPQVYKTGDIIDTLVYRLGIVDAQYGVATAVGLFKSLITFSLMAISYKMAYKFAGYKIF